jgi:hypothetical protein
MPARDRFGAAEAYNAATAFVGALFTISVKVETFCKASS